MCVQLPVQRTSSSVTREAVSMETVSVTPWSTALTPLMKLIVVS